MFKNVNCTLSSLIQILKTTPKKNCNKRYEEAAPPAGHLFFSSRVLASCRTSSRGCENYRRGRVTGSRAESNAVDFRLEFFDAFISFSRLMDEVASLTFELWIFFFFWKIFFFFSKVFKLLILETRWWSMIFLLD